MKERKRKGGFEWGILEHNPAGGWLFIRDWDSEMSAKEGALLSNTGNSLLAFIVMKSGNP